MIRHSKYNQVDSAIIYGFAVLSVLILSNIQRPVVHVLEKKLVTSEVKEVPELFSSSSFDGIDVRAKSYVVYDIVDKKIISEKNSSDVLPVASITKVMTALTARIHNDKTKNITIGQSSIDGAYDLGLKKGQIFNLDELLKYTLVFSSNDGAQAIADGLGGRNFFISQMNTDATTLGLDLHFTSPAGLDENGKIGGEGSALSIAKLTALARREFPEVFEATTRRRTNVTANTGRIIGIPNTNQNVNKFPGIEMSKTGYTDIAGGNLVIVVDILIGHPVAIVVLGSTLTERFTDVEILYKALLSSVSK
ncbi:hypothetical protein K9M47_01740 [Candidatus Gracilibacteria bacterium]|nr:hypothetical protein [Candidatus Gracilibacteria bacterium]MCF7898423.1 hypothetical protein [Candidatus Paceibacterota bacterium]